MPAVRIILHRILESYDCNIVTLEDIRKLIAAGERVKIVVDKTGEDITRI